MYCDTLLYLRKKSILLKEFLAKNPFSCASILLLLSTLFIALRKPSRAYFEGWDFLDSTFVYQYLRAKHVLFFEFGSQIPEVLNGVEIDALGMSDFSFESVSYKIFDPFLANALIEGLTRLLAFIGIFLLLGALGNWKGNHDLVRGLGSLTFALVPWHPHLGMTIALQPWFFLLLSSKYFKKPLLSLPILFILSQNINFALGGFLNLGLLMIYSTYLLLKKQLILKALALLLTGGLGFFIANIRLFHLLLFTDFESHRLDWPTSNSLINLSNFGTFSEKLWSALIKGIPHFGNPQSVRFFLPFRNGSEYWYFGLGVVGFIVLLPILLRLIMVTKSNFGVTRKNDGNLPQRFVFFLILQVSISCFYVSEEIGLTNFKYLSPVPWQFSRVAVLLPTLTCILFAISIGKLMSLMKGQIKNGVIFALFSAIMFQASYSYYPINGKIREVVNFSQVTNISEYFEQSSYLKLKSQLQEISGKKDIVVLSYNLDPMVASFNGFFSLDGYSYNYSRVYKEQFRNIIQSQLSRDISAKRYFDEWGSRAYLIFEGAYPNIDWCAAKVIGAEYVLTKDILKGNGVTFEILVGEIYAYRIDSCR